MLAFALDRTSPCKRDALPTELTAPTAEMRRYLGFQGHVKRHVNGTGRQRPEHDGLGSPEIVPDGLMRGSSLAPALTNNLCGGYMADAFPKQILPLLEGRIGELRIMRFWSKVDMRGPDECWEWQGSRHGRGYGTFKIVSYVTVTASRMALICNKMQEPSGMLVLHDCDNPPCCNPHHLYFGTTADNIADKVKRGRARTGDQSGSSNGAAKLTDEQVALIVHRLKSGWNNKQIAADLPVTHSMVSLIRLGKMWAPTAARFGWAPKTLTPTQGSSNHVR